MAVPAAGTPVGEGIGLGSLLEVGAALGIVVLAILALAWALRRLQGSGAGTGAQLKVVAAITIGPRERVLVVDAAGTQLLLGVTPTQITRLHEFPAPLIVAARPRGADFGARLRQALDRDGEG
jgi:flagellar protein FliO/FliZ